MSGQLIRRRGVGAVLAGALLLGAGMAVVPTTSDRADALSYCYGKVYRNGSRGDCVKDIQEILNIDDYGPARPLTVDGVYGINTEDDVYQLQSELSGYPNADGVVGPFTWKLLCEVDRGSDGPEVDAGCP